MTVTAANDIGSLYNVSSDAVKNILAGSSDTTQETTRTCSAPF